MAAGALGLSSGLFYEEAHAAPAAEVPADLYEYRHLVEDPLTDWIVAARKLPPSSKRT